MEGGGGKRLREELKVGSVRDLTYSLSFILTSSSTSSYCEVEGRGWRINRVMGALMLPGPQFGKPDVIRRREDSRKDWGWKEKRWWR